MPCLPKRVLYAEPNDDIRAMITLFLEMQGYEVKSAKTVAECLALAGSRHFDLYLLDGGYLDGTSIELCQRLRRMSPQTPIMFYSSAAFERGRLKGLQAGAQAYLTKPGDILDLAAAVDRLTDQSYAA